MRTLLSFILLLLIAIAAAAQSPKPTPPPSSTPTPEDRPTLNRPGSSNTGLGSATPTPTPYSSPAAQPAQAEANAEPPKPSYPDLLPRFDYDSHAGLEMRETDVQKRDKVRLIELNYAGASGDRVPAYLLIPPGGGPFPAIIWGHWLKKGSPLANKDEFLEEAVILARSGVVSLLIDAPQARNEWVEAKGDAGPLEAAKQQSEASVHQVTDLRRGIDLLYGRPDVDRKRIAYVGHSWDAHVGAILAGVETRIIAYVLMASGYADEEEAFASKDPQRMAQIKQVGADNVHEYFREYAWDDPVYFLGHTDRESIFLQFASGDGISKEVAQKYLDRFSSKDKKMEFYDAPHALNAAARLDRDRWLQKHLGIKKIDEKELEAIPQLK
ncbi:MAG: alpha/beta hydrolase family protein [Candidatus Angelobacter sp.]